MIKTFFENISTRKDVACLNVSCVTVQSKVGAVNITRTEGNSVLISFTVAEDASQKDVAYAFDEAKKALEK